MWRSVSTNRIARPSSSSSSNNSSNKSNDVLVVLPNESFLSVLRNCGRTPRDCPHSVVGRCLQEFAVGGNLLLINTAHVSEGGPDNVMFLMRVTHVSEISSCVTTVEWRLHLGNHRAGHQQEFPRHATHRSLAPTSSDSFLRHATLTKTSLRTRTQPTKSL